MTLSYRIGQKIKLQTLVHIYTNGFHVIIYISQDSVATQLRYGGIFCN